ncbi:MAG: ArsB/NhaD family transporter [Cetobacterium sp.]|uniref:ArsB/NhaD family transporter n=1 Tax=unclassified Cetobacterium TaxID=2630983 RepID=UPI00163B6504|nr:ArsB/NhaD family transporter [Cetobacterium sp. 2A]MBC2856404.1 ArsB/NhaD family transporter [Cetobacterium sp. 2A]
MLQMVLGLTIFIVVFYLIISERVPGAWATMIGGLAMAMTGIINQEQALEAVSGRLEILFLLIGMMIIVHMISETGVFQWFAIKVAQVVRGEPFRLIVLLAVVTALCSAFLDNVTTILLMAPVSILLANQLKLDPFPFIITEVMAANIGGLATLIGDPTQLIIGYEGKLTFIEFLVNTAPVSVIAMIILIVNVYFMYGKDMKVSRELKARIMELDASRTMKDKKLLKEAGVIFILVILGFLLNNVIDKGLAMIALTGAITLVIIDKRKPEDVLGHVEWDTLFFFIGLFMLVKGIDATHLINILGDKLAQVTAGNFAFAAIGITWISALFTSIIGNVANAATFSKIVQVMSPSFEHLGNTQAFWWALSFGSLLGGNITILGSATNVVAVGAAAKAGCKIDFMKFFKFGSLIAVQTLIAASIYLYIKFL